MILLVAVLLTGCRAGDVPPVFKIALIAPFEGPSRPLGYNVLAAAHLRIQAWNESGETPRLELVALNDDGDPALAANLAAQLALDPDVIAVIGPPQGPTALAAAPALAAQGLPTFLLAPVPDPPPSPVIAFGGLAADVQMALKGYAPEAIPEYQGWPAQPALWLGDPMTLAAIRRQAPELAPVAGSVAAEDAFAAWACPERSRRTCPAVDDLVWVSNLQSPISNPQSQSTCPAVDGLVWAAAMPDTLPPDFVRAYTEATGSPPDPVAALAYAAADRIVLALAGLRPVSPDRARMANALERKAVSLVARPPMRVFMRDGATCCIPLPIQPPVN